MLFRSPDGSGLVRRSRRATDATIRELKREGRLEAVDAGLVALLRTLADLLDAELGADDPSAWTMARLAAEWRATYAELRGNADTWDAQIAAFFEEGAGGGGSPVPHTP